MLVRLRAVRGSIKHRFVKSAVQYQARSRYISANAPISGPSATVHNDDDFYRYTSGRWLYNETIRLEERHLPFDIRGLEEVAAKAVNKTARDVTNIRKLAEGGFNRIFLVTMTNGVEIIARLPFTIAFPDRLTLASEVATLALIKLHGVPVPTVLDYSTTKENPVGTEYIIMEKASGFELGDRWFSLPDTDRATIIGRLSKIEQALFSIPLPASGSIFFKKDLDPSIPTEEIPGTEFCVGPSVEQRWWYGQRDGTPKSSGPFVTTKQFLEAGAVKELAWLKAHGRPRFPAGKYKEFIDYQKADPAEHIASLEKYLQITPYLVPDALEYHYLLKPTIRHPDLNPRNIFVDKDLQISSLIDWQHCSAVPLFLQAGVPDCFENFGDEDSVQLKKPVLPEDLSKFSELEQGMIIERYRRRHVHFYYFAGARNFNNNHYRALRLLTTRLRQRLCFEASAPWQGNNIPLKAILIEAIERWNLLTSESVEKSASCPLSFSDAEIRTCLRISAAQNSIDENIEMLRDRLGIGSDGWVPLDMYDHAVAENLALKDEVLEGETEAEKKLTLQHWPFDDHAEDGSS